jgi:hypothetical protein
MGQYLTPGFLYKDGSCVALYQKAHLMPFKKTGEMRTHRFVFFPLTEPVGSLLIFWGVVL